MAEGEGETLSLLFQLVDECLGKGKIGPAKIGEYIYGEGPGSTLGLRVAAIAIELWKSGRTTPDAVLRRFNRLHWLASVVRCEYPDNPPLVAAPWKRKHLFLLDPKEQDSSITGCSLDELNPKGRKIIAWNDGPFPLDLPDGIEVRSYEIPFDSSELKAYLENIPQTDHASPFQILPAEFKRWEGERFRRPS